MTEANIYQINLMSAVPPALPTLLGFDKIPNFSRQAGQAGKLNTHNTALIAVYIDSYVITLGLKGQT